MVLFEIAAVEARLSLDDKLTLHFYGHDGGQDGYDIPLNKLSRMVTTPVDGVAQLEILSSWRNCSKGLCLEVIGSNGGYH